jgi:hypothetical protein
VPLWEKESPGSCVRRRLGSLLSVVDAGALHQDPIPRSWVTHTTYPWTGARCSLEGILAGLGEEETPDGSMRKQGRSFTRRCRRGYYIIRCTPDRGYVHVRRALRASSEAGKRKAPAAVMKKAC